MHRVRMPVVAGAFYPSDPVELRRTIVELLDKAAIPKRLCRVLGVVSPHAGYVYSGLGAAHAFKILMGRPIETLVMLAPSHRVGGYLCSVGDYDFYRTPLGDMPVDREAVQALLQKEEIAFLPVAHNGEHSLEVQIPFAQVALPRTKLVPMVLGEQNDANAARLADILLETFGDRLDSVAFVASTDLSHYHPGDEANALDARFVEMIEQLDTLSLADSIAARSCEACGYGAVLTLMHMAMRLGDTAYDTLARFHSGDVSGNNEQVVGYTAGVFHRLP